MSNFYIKAIKAYGTGKTTSEIKLINGLNIIHGESNTGKTCIANTIIYLFGKESTEGLFDADKTGYNELEMTLLYKDVYDITFHRVIGENSVFVSSECPEIPSGIYKLKSSKKDEPILNDIILKMIGFAETPMIGVSAASKKEKLSWRTFVKTLYLDKDSVDESGSPLIPNDTNKSTRVLSSLLFFLTGEDHSALEAGLSQNERKSRREAVDQFVQFQLEKTESQISELEIKLSDYGTEEEVQRMIAETKESIISLTSEIDKLQEEISDDVSQYHKLEDAIRNKEIISSRYSNLITQYISDIERLNFIANGETILTEAETAPRRNCPFCGSTIEQSHIDSCLEAANYEIKKILVQIEEVQTLNDDLINELANDKAHLKSIAAARKNHESLLNKKLTEKKVSLERLNHFFNYDKVYRQYLYLCQLRDILPKEAENYSDPKDIKNKKYNPKDYFDEHFCTTMQEYMMDIFSKLGSKVSDARLDLKTFDIVVNGYKKQNTQGQGFSSLFNTVLYLSLHKYFREHAAYDPNLLIIDTPLLGLVQWKNLQEQTYSTSLYKYLVNHRNEGQVIIIENSSTLPDIDEPDVNLIRFTGDPTNGRHGFLIDYIQRS